MDKWSRNELEFPTRRARLEVRAGKLSSTLKYQNGSRN